MTSKSEIWTQFERDVNAAIDACRADLWDTADMKSVSDNWQRRHDREQAAAQIIGAIVDYRSGDLSYRELHEFLLTFDKNVTPDDVDYLIAHRGAF